MSKIVDISKPGGLIAKPVLSDWRSIIADNRWCDTSNERMFRMLNKILELELIFQISILPLSRSSAEFAIHKLLCEGGLNGQVACDSTINDFKRAVSHWHFHNGYKVPDFAKWDLDWYFTVLPRLRMRQPKNQSINPHASHGHLQLPFDIFQRTAFFWLYELSVDLDVNRKAASRDLLLMVLLWVAAKRQSEVFAMSREDIIDLGVDNGFSWLIKVHKTSHIVGRLVTRLPEATDYDLPVGSLLRAFLRFAPKSGFLFRKTANGGKSWVDDVSSRSVWQQDGKKMCFVWAGFKSGTWNSELRKRIATACPDFASEVKLISAHSLRGGAASEALQAGIPRDVVQQMVGHKDPASLSAYTRLSQVELCRSYAKVGAKKRG